MKTSLLTKITVCLTLFCLVGCKTSVQARERPAVVETSEPATLALLEQVVGEALGGIPITLAKDALVKTDRLIIERKKHMTIEGRVFDGRSYEVPEHFRLVIKDTTCTLIHEKTEKRYPLKKVVCRVFKTE